MAVESLKELVKRLCDFVDQCENSNNNDEDNINDPDISRQRLETVENLDSSTSGHHLRGHSETLVSEISLAIDQNFSRVEKQKIKKQMIVRAIQKFNLKPKNGLQFMI